MAYFYAQAEAFAPSAIAANYGSVLRAKLVTHS